MALGVETSRSFGLRRLVDEVDVWLARIGPEGDSEQLRRCRELLTGDELESSSAFHREVDRRRAVVSRALLRTTLSRYAGIPADAWRFERGAHGRPEIAGPRAQRLRFSLAHTHEFAVCAVTLDAPIGVDLETSGRCVDDLVESESILTRPEIDALRALGPRERSRRFLEIWTLKESYLKALGTGLSRAPNELEFALDTGGTIVGRLAGGAESTGPPWWFSILGVEAEPDLVLALSRCGRPVRVTAFLATPPDFDFDSEATTLLASSSGEGT